MKKVIAILLITVMLISSPVVLEETAKAAATTATTVIIGKVVLEILAICGSAYVITDLANAYLPFQNRSIISVSEYNNSTELKAQWSQDFGINYLDGYVSYNCLDKYNVTLIEDNGELWFINPDHMRVYAQNGFFEKLIEYSKTFAKMSVKNIYQAVNLVRSYVEGVTNNFGLSCKQLINNVALSHQGFSVLNNTGRGFTALEKTEIENDFAIQKLRYDTLFKARTSDFGMDNYIIMKYFNNYYKRYMVNVCWIKDLLEYSYDSVQRKFTYSTKSNGCCSFIYDMGLNGDSWSFDSNNSNIYSNGVLYIPQDAIVYFNNGLFEEIGTKYSCRDYPYFGEMDVVVIETPVYEKLVDGTMDVPTENVLTGIQTGTLTKDTIVGAPTLEKEYVDTTVVTPDLDAEKEYQTGVFGWLQKLWDKLQQIWDAIVNGIIGVITTIKEKIIGIFSLLDKLGNTVLQALKDFVQWLLVPDSVAIGAHVEEMKAIITDQTGVLTYPIAMTLSFIDEVANVDVKEKPIHIPSIKFMNKEIMPEINFYLSNYIESAGLLELYNTYLIIVDAIMVLCLCGLARKKWDEMMEG